MKAYRVRIDDREEIVCADEVSVASAEGNVLTFRRDGVVVAQFVCWGYWIERWEPPMAVPAGTAILRSA